MDINEFVDAAFGKDPEPSNINFSSNGFKSIVGIERLKSLVILNLSRNVISNLRPLSELKRLTNLDLSENMISDIAPLKVLTELRFLDLSGNKIMNFDSLTPIKSLSKLQTINLKGNPVCVANYLHLVFGLQSSVQNVDGILRNYFTATSLRGGFIEEDVQHSTAEMQSLKDQLRSMTEALTVQEALIAKNGLEVAVRAATVSGKNRAELESFPYGRLLEGWRKKVTQLMLVNIATERNMEQLFNTSRADRELSREHLSEVESRYLVERAVKERFLSENEQLRATCSDREGKLHQVIKDCYAMKTQQDQLKSTLVAVKSTVHKAAHHVSQQFVEDGLIAKHIGDRLRYFEDRLSTATKNLLLLSVALRNKESTLKFQQKQLELQSRREQICAVRAQHEQALSRAVGGKRDLSAPSTHSNSPVRSATFLTAAEDDELLDVAGMQLQFLSEVRLDGSHKALLKDMFLMLCERNSRNPTLMRVSDILAEVFVRYEITQELHCLELVHEYLIERLCGASLDSLLRSGDFFRPYGVEIYECLGKVNFIRLLLSLLSTDMSEEAASDESPSELTFADLVMCLHTPKISARNRSFVNQLRYFQQRLLPDDHHVTISDSERSALARTLVVSSCSRSMLTRRERLALQKYGWLGDAHFGCPPMRISPKHMASDPIQQNSGKESSHCPAHYTRGLSSVHRDSIVPPPSVQQLVEENQQLTTERSYLLKKLQQQEQQLESRAEKIRFFFESDIAECGAKNAALSTRNEELHREKNKLQARLDELELAFKQHREAAEETALKLRTKVDDLETSARERAAALQSQHGSEVSDLMTKCAGLESKLQALDKEHKQAVASFNNAQRRETNSERERLKLRADLDSLTAQSAAEISKLAQRLKGSEEQLSGEKLEHQTKVNSLQEQVISLQEALQKSQEQLQTAKEQLQTTRDQLSASEARVSNAQESGAPASATAKAAAESVAATAASSVQELTRSALPNVSTSPPVWPLQGPLPVTSLQYLEQQQFHPYYHQQYLGADQRYHHPAGLHLPPAAAQFQQYPANQLPISPHVHRHANPSPYDIKPPLGPPKDELEQRREFQEIQKLPQLAQMEALRRTLNL